MKELIITPPEGYEIDQENSTFEKIVFKPIDTKPRSWDDFIVEHLNEESWGFQMPLPSKEMAEQVVAFCKLLCLRQDWIGNWKPDLNGKTIVYTITYNLVSNIFVIEGRQFEPAALSFPTHEIAKEFLNCFKDLLEQAKILL